MADSWERRRRKRFGNRPYLYRDSYSRMISDVTNETPVPIGKFLGIEEKKAEKTLTEETNSKEKVQFKGSYTIVPDSAKLYKPTTNHIKELEAEAEKISD